MFLCLVFLMILRLFIVALWSLVRKKLTYWLFLVMFIVFCYFPIGILPQVWYFIVLFRDLCCLSYLNNNRILGKDLAPVICM